MASPSGTPEDSGKQRGRDGKMRREEDDAPPEGKRLKLGKEGGDSGKEEGEDIPCLGREDTGTQTGGEGRSILGSGHAVIYMTGIIFPLTAVLLGLALLFDNFVTLTSVPGVILGLETGLIGHRQGFEHSGTWLDVAMVFGFAISVCGLICMVLQPCTKGYEPLRKR